MVSSLSRRKHSMYIQLTGIMSIVSLVIVCTSFGTKDWIRAIANPNIDGPVYSNVKHGLFKGTLTRRPIYSPYEYDLYFTCVWGENSCAWSCLSDDDLRKIEVQNLIDGNKPPFSCLPTQSTANFAKLATRISTRTDNERIFTNGGLWLATIIFIVIVIIALLVSVVLSVVNCMKSPIETFFNIEGIYVANGIALVANLLALILYGTCYDIYIKKNISILDTIVGEYSSEASLGYSYWILIVPCLFHGVGIFLIAMREIIVNSDRAETKIDVAADTPADGVLF